MKYSNGLCEIFVVHTERHGLMNSGVNNSRWRGSRGASNLWLGDRLILFRSLIVNLFRIRIILSEYVGNLPGIILSILTGRIE